MSEGRTKMVPKSTKCLGSEKGHYGFWYPTEEEGIFTQDAIVKVFNWSCSNKNLKAVQVKTSAITGISLFSSREDTIVWVDSETIQRW